jgi:hypothetical protein
VRPGPPAGCHASATYTSSARGFVCESVETGFGCLHARHLNFNSCKSTSRTRGGQPWCQWLFHAACFLQSLGVQERQLLYSTADCTHILQAFQCNSLVCALKWAAQLSCRKVTVDFRQSCTHLIIRSKLGCSEDDSTLSCWHHTPAHTSRSAHSISMSASTASNTKGEQRHECWYNTSMLA